jgi:hypothetical protein
LRSRYRAIRSTELKQQAIAEPGAVATGCYAPVEFSIRLPDNLNFGWIVIINNRYASITFASRTRDHKQSHKEVWKEPSSITKYFH